MTGTPTNAALFVVIYPYKFTEFAFDLLELASFEPYCNVVVWDISPITTPRFSKAVSADRSANSAVRVIATWADFVRRVSDLRRRSVDTSICILNEVTYNSASQTLCNLFMTVALRGTRVRMFDLYNDGSPQPHVVPATTQNRAARFSMLVAKGVRFLRHTSSFSEMRRRLASAVYARIARSLPSATTHRLVGGEDQLGIARAKGRRHRNVQIVRGHSYDYSNYLRRRELAAASRSELPDRTGVLLDGAGPMFGGDGDILRRRVYRTSEVWYPALSKFFDRVEHELGATIEIAGHYKSKHPAIAPCFGNRRVHYGKTFDLVRDSDFVITIWSTAVSYAVVFRKPVILIYSNQLQDDRLVMRGIRSLAEMLGTDAVNIDDPNISIEPLLRVDEERYATYERTCLTLAGSSRTNAQIILEDIMGIPTGSHGRAQPDSSEHRGR